MVKQAVRHSQSLEEVLEHANIHKTWQEIVASGTEQAVMDVDLDGSGRSMDALSNFVEVEALSKLQMPEHSSQRQTVENAAELSRRMVKSQIQTVDGSQSLEKLAKLLFRMDVMKLRGGTDHSFLVLYGIEAAGEHEKDSRRSPTPARRDHQEKIMRAIFCSRGEELLNFDDSDKLVFPQLDPSDVSHGHNARQCQISSH